MYVRVVWGRIKPGRWDDYERYYDENVEPITENVKGCRGRQLLRSVENPDEGISVTFWDTLQDLQDYVRSPEHARVALREAEHLYVGEYWEKHLEIRSSALSF